MENTPEPSIFTKIIKGEIPGVRVFEDESVIVLMDKFPSTKGQVLVIPKEQIDYIFDIPDPLYSHLFEVSKKIAKALDAAFKPKRVCVVIEGFQVPHTHIRLYPVPAGEPLDPHPGAMADDVELEQLAEQIRHAFE